MSEAPSSDNTRETLATVLRSRTTQRLSCALFGGWAEELHGLRPPWPHRDIDLIFRGDDLAGFDALSETFTPVPAKRFHHKRAFRFRDVLCEIILVQDAESNPVTRYWGDVPFRWEKPLLHPQAMDVCGAPASVISADNLRRHRRLHHELQPERWCDPASLVP